MPILQSLQNSEKLVCKIDFFMLFLTLDILDPGLPVLQVEIGLSLPKSTCLGHHVIKHWIGYTFTCQQIKIHNTVSKLYFPLKTIAMQAQKVIY